MTTRRRRSQHGGGADNPLVLHPLGVGAIAPLASAGGLAPFVDGPGVGDRRRLGDHARLTGDAGAPSEIGPPEGGGTPWLSSTRTRTEGRGRRRSLCRGRGTPSGWSSPPRRDRVEGRAGGARGPFRRSRCGAER